MWTRRQFDTNLPTLVRYTGWLLSLVLVGFILAGHYVEAAIALPTAAGMLLYKTVYDASKGGNGGRAET